MNALNHIKETVNKDDKALALISSTVSNKIKARLEVLHADDNFKDIKHVQINYFNIAKLGKKYQDKNKNKNKTVGMSYGDVVVTNQHTGDEQPKQYLCVIVVFDEEPLTSNTFQMLLGLTSKIHNWKYSDSDDVYIDELGVYVDRVDFEKQTEEGVV